MLRRAFHTLADVTYLLIVAVLEPFRKHKLIAHTRQTAAAWSVGDFATLETVVTGRDIKLFCRRSGDDNPLHLDDAFAAATPFRGVIAPGMLSAAFVSCVLGKYIPGHGTLWLREELDFVGVVRPGDCVQTTGRILEITNGSKPGLQKIKLETICAKRDGVQVIKGIAFVSYKPIAAAAAA